MSVHRPQTLAGRCWIHILSASLALVLAACGPTSPSPNLPANTATVRPAASQPPVSRDELVDAMNVRNRFGLRADEAWIRHVAADPDAQAGLTEFGIPLTPAELDDLMSRRWDEGLLLEVKEYGLAFPDEFAGAYLNLKSSGVIVEFTDEIDRHRRALENLVADPSLIEVADVDWSLKALEGFMTEVEAEAPWFDALGLRFLQARHPVDENVVYVDFVGPTEDSARVVREHFGNPTWLRTTRHPPPWEGPRGDLLIKVINSRGQPVPGLWCEVIPQDPRVPHGSETIFGTGPDGICQGTSNLPAVAYRVLLHEWIDNDHYDPEPVAELPVSLPAAGKTVVVTLPSSAE